MTERNPVQAELFRVDRALARLSLIPPGMRDELWRAKADTLLTRRAELMAERDRGFRVSDRRRVRE